MTQRKRLAVLISGRGSNFVAIEKAIRSGELDAEIVIVLSNRPKAPGLTRASEAGLRTAVVDHKTFHSREEHEAAVSAAIDAAGADLIVLAGYMRLLSADFVSRFRNRIVNIHPSLLPAFPGVNAQEQAVAYGVKISGCTVHLVDETLDGGPIVVQRAVLVEESDTGDRLAARILDEEHRAYVEALKKLCECEYRVDGRRVLFS